MYIPERFKRAIAVHIVKNLIPDLAKTSPLILGIHGPSGYGKTFQCEHVLRELGVKSFLISGGQLESKDAGEPAKLIRDTYIKTGDYVDTMPGTDAYANLSLHSRERHLKYPLGALLINDIDTGLGNWGEMVQYTTNRQMVFGELMHLVDYPELIENRRTRRIPIIVTGNDFTKLYEPLVRAGRMVSFNWCPNLAEKAQIVASILPEITIEQATSLIVQLEEYANNQGVIVPDLPVSFFSHLRSTVVDEHLWVLLKSTGLRESIDGLIKGTKMPDLPLPTFKDLLNIGKDILKSGQLINHLRII